MSLKPCGLEGLRIFYILPAYMMNPARQDLINIYMKKFLDLDRERMKVICTYVRRGGGERDIRASFFLVL